MGNPKFRRVKRCIFCHGKADSKEHAWSEWAVKRLAHPGGTYGEFDGAIYRDPRQKHLKVKCVCEGCNEGWMKRLEDAIIPTVGTMMNDEPTTLDIAQQWAIARWAVKCSMVFEYINITEPIFYTDAERENLRLSGAIPAQTFVVIARGIGIDYFFTWGNELTSAALNLYGQVTTIAYRRLLVQVVSVRTDQPQGAKLILKGDLKRWGDSTVRIWPTQEIARWPNGSTIASAPEMEAFHWRVQSMDIEEHDGAFSTLMG
jgi:hypothetical protein